MNWWSRGPKSGPDYLTHTLYSFLPSFFFTCTMGKFATYHCRDPLGSNCVFITNWQCNVVSQLTVRKLKLWRSWDLSKGSQSIIIKFKPLYLNSIIIHSVYMWYLEYRWLWSRNRESRVKEETCAFIGQWFAVRSCDINRYPAVLCGKIVRGLGGERKDTNLLGRWQMESAILF